MARRSDTASTAATATATAAPAANPAVTDDPDAPSDLDLARVGAELRKARKAAGLSMGELGRRSGVSQPFISQVERGLFAPSLVTLYKIAAALGIPASRLLPAGSDQGSKIVRAGHGVPVAMSDLPDSPISKLISRAGDLIEALHFKIDSEFEPYWFEHPGEDFIYVLSGSLEVEVKPDPPVILGPGDSFHHGGEAAHAWRLPAGAKEGVELLLVVTHPEHARFTET